MGKIVSGTTAPGATNWQPYNDENVAVFVDVDTSSAQFSTTPLYFTSIGGGTAQWEAIGVTAIYAPTPTSFRVNLRWVNGGELTPALANHYQWVINWVGVEP